MKTQVLIIIFLLLFVASCASLAATDDQQPGQTSTSAPTTRNTADAKKKELERKDRKDDGDKDLDREEKARLEYKARREAERRERIERLRRGGHYHDDPFTHDPPVIIVEPTGGYPYPTEDDPAAYSSYREKPERTRSNTAGVVFAPAQRGKSSSLGIQWMGPRNVGATLWLSGRLYRGDDVIEGTIPHDDYYIDSNKGSYGLQGTAGFGSADAMLVVGAGLTVKQTLYTAVSNVTGWKWEAGSDSKARASAQVGMRFTVAERFNLHFGYDTSQYAFFGFSGSF